MSDLARSPLAHGVAAATALLSTACIGVSARRTVDGQVTDPAALFCRGDLVPSDSGLIDDFEDGNHRVAQVSGRGGYWWKSADSAGSVIGPDDFTPIPQGPDGSLALHVVGHTAKGDPVDAWGAQFGADFVSGGGYDGTRYAAIAFKARVAEGTNPKVRFKVGDSNTHPSFGNCQSCWNHFGRDLTLTTDWKEYVVMFSAISQEPFWGDPRPAAINLQQLHSLVFSFAPGNEFELWVDDLRFLACER